MNNLITEPKGISGIEFIIGENKKILGIDSLYKLKTSLSTYIEYVEHWQYYIKLYENFDLEKDLLDSYNEEEKLYSIGNVFAQYIDGDVVEYLKNNFEDFNELDIDNERSFTWIYTKNNETARKFLSWSYETLIKPTLEKLK